MSEETVRRRHPMYLWRTAAQQFSVTSTYRASAYFRVTVAKELFLVVCAVWRMACRRCLSSGIPGPLNVPQLKGRCDRCRQMPKEESQPNHTHTFAMTVSFCMAVGLLVTFTNHILPASWVQKRCGVHSNMSVLCYSISARIFDPAARFKFRYLNDCITVA